MSELVALYSELQRLNRRLSRLEEVRQWRPIQVVPDPGGPERQFPRVVKLDYNNPDTAYGALYPGVHQVDLRGEYSTSYPLNRHDAIVHLTSSAPMNKISEITLDIVELEIDFGYIAGYGEYYDWVYCRPELTKWILDDFDPDAVTWNTAATLTTANPSTATYFDNQHRLEEALARTGNPDAVIRPGSALVKQINESASTTVYGFRLVADVGSQWAFSTNYPDYGYVKMDQWYTGVKYTPDVTNVLVEG